MEEVKKITYDEALEMYKEDLEETKHSWIENYDGAIALERIDPTAFNVGFEDWKSNNSELYEVE